MRCAETRWRLRWVRVLFDREFVLMNCTYDSLQRSSRRGVRRDCRSLPRAIIRISAALVLATSMAAPVAAQDTGVNATIRVGIATADDDYAATCGAESIAYSIDVQGRRRWFPQLTVDKFSGSGGATTACSFEGVIGGGLQLDGATRIGVGTGTRVGNRWVILEGAVLAGLITGRRGFTLPQAGAKRVALPHVGGQLRVVFFRYAVIAGTYHRVRLTFDGDPVGRSSATARQRWSPMYTWQIGARVPLGRRAGT